MDNPERPSGSTSLQNEGITWTDLQSPSEEFMSSQDPGRGAFTRVIDRKLERWIQEYRQSDGSKGIRREVREYALQHPEALLDRSGDNRSPDDERFRFFNPDPRKGDIEGVNWFPEDPRYNPDAIALKNKEKDG
jgi:hypothetical protein